MTSLHSSFRFKGFFKYMTHLYFWRSGGWQAPSLAASLPFAQCESRKERNMKSNNKMAREAKPRSHSEAAGCVPPAVLSAPLVL